MIESNNTESNDNVSNDSFIGPTFTVEKDVDIFCSSTIFILTHHIQIFVKWGPVSPTAAIDSDAIAEVKDKSKNKRVSHPTLNTSSW